MVTYRQALQDVILRLDEVNIEDSLFDAKQMLGKALKTDCCSGEFSVLLEKEAENALLDEFSEYADRRCNGEPLQYILGEWEFYGIPFDVGEGVLIPRQDTETVVETVLKKMADSEQPVVIDLCTGTGCIAVATEKNLDCKAVYAVEKYPKAFEFLCKNIEKNCSKVTAVMGDVTDKTFVESGKLPMADVIVCNPPYLTQKDMNELQTEVKAEPKTALFGGEDGLEFYQTIVRLWKSNLVSGGMMAFEIGIGQENDIVKLLIQHGFENVRMRKDLCGINRCVFGFKK